MRNITKTQTASAGGAEGDQRAPRRNLRSKAGFTLPELLVLVAVGAVLTGLLVPELSQTRSKLLQQACAANLKNWGMAFYLYSQDYSGTIFMYNSGNALNWDDTTSSDGTMTNAYLKYLGGGAPTTRIRKMRTCPAIAGRLTEDQIVNGQHHNYGMIWPSVRLPGIGWTTLPPTAGTWYVIPVRVLSKPAEYLLLIDSNTENVPLSSFLRATTGNDHETGLPVMSRHSNAVNCLFGDQHVELVSSNRIIQQSGIPITRNTWFQLN